MNSNINPDDILDENYVIYKKAFDKHGYSKDSLLWTKDKQNMRYYALTSGFNLSDTSLLDIGCGFGDLYRYILRTSSDNGRTYHGLDIMPEFIAKAQELYQDYPNATFEIGNFLNMKIQRQYDYIVSSGIFNLISREEGIYEYIEFIMKKAFQLCDRAISMDFLSHYVNFKREGVFYSKPEKILNIAYSMSRNVVLRNDYFPFEFCITVYKDDTYHEQNTYFNSFANEHKEQFDSGLFAR